MLERLLSHPRVYRAWQAPFAFKKIAPVLANLPDLRSLSVLDVGCGPGTNRGHLIARSYVGVDLNPQYIDWAHKRYDGTFIAGDAASALPDDLTFDVVLLNSLLHHLDDAAAHDVLVEAARRVGPRGRVHILDLIEPDDLSVARLLARLDRGHFARSFANWRRLFDKVFEQQSVTTFRLGLPGVTLWHMIYYQGYPPRER
jgi:SAM-dependent methyltransferase